MNGNIRHHPPKVFFSVWISITHIDCRCTDQIDVQRDQPISQRPA